ncbi:hypothetical protein BCR34DRAFT_555322 [Clohesyomyces aquaticus]|uniref:DUF2423 domain-containing protein n=1 Tax=Clohesyomyces aquaticus TaxID=1231657 RepID=A0A1Y2A594_9PLEO|nr:hypothetical protein BCR34DRAFT_555322 [Clohesyomyces aquaticus]
MAKGLRSSVKKANRTKLRSRVFGPVEAARNERLHEKLLELVNAPKPEPRQKPNNMDVDPPKASADVSLPADDTLSTDDKDMPKEMDIDGDAATSAKSTKKRVHRSKLNRRRKPRNQITFPQSRGKGALKPFSESRTRVSKRR